MELSRLSAFGLAHRLLMIQSATLQSSSLKMKSGITKVLVVSSLTTITIENQKDNFWNREFASVGILCDVWPRFTPNQGASALSRLKARKLISLATSDPNSGKEHSFDGLEQIVNDIRGLGEKPSVSAMAFLQAALYARKHLISPQLSLEQVITADDLAAIGFLAEPLSTPPLAFEH